MRKRLTLVLLLILLVTGGVYLFKDTFAKYFSTASKSKPLAVAKWNFDKENLGEGKEFVVNISPSADPTSLTAGKIAPGASGTFSLNLTNAQGDTAVEFTLKLGEVSGKPTNLKFYKDSGFVNEIDSQGIKGIMKAKDGTGLNAVVYWKWPYYTSSVADGQDTTAGSAAANLNVPITIEASQAQPGTEAVVSKFLD